jgi:hypothetical protein
LSLNSHLTFSRVQSRTRLSTKPAKAAQPFRFSAWRLAIS